MKKLLTTLLAILIGLCIINFNTNNTKAEDDENGKETEVVEKAIENPTNEVLEVTKENSKIEELNDAIEVEAEDNDENKNVLINSGSELIKYLKNKNTGIATLNCDITINGDGIVQETMIKTNKTIDLNGHNIIFVDTLALLVREDSNDSVEVDFINKSGTTSYFVPADNREGYALVATRLHHNIKGTKTLNLNIKGDIVFDGRNQNGLVGLAVGYSSLNPFHEVGYYDTNIHNVYVAGAKFTGFGNGYEEHASAAIASAFGRTVIENVIIDDCSIGVASGNINPNIIRAELNPAVNLVNSSITECYYGIVNGVDVGLMFFEEVVPGMVSLFKNTEVCNNVIGAVYFNNSKEDYREFVVNDSIILNNIYIDYYAQGQLAVFQAVDTVLIGKTPTKIYVDLSYWKDAMGLKKIDVIVGKFKAQNEMLFSMTSGLVAETDRKTVFLRPTQETDPTPVTKESGDLYRDKDDNFIGLFCKGLQNNPVAHIGNVEILDVKNVEVFDVNNVTYLEYGKHFYISDGSVKVIFNRDYLNSLPVGTHEMVILLTTTKGNFPFRVFINILENKIDPGKKDESCEKVIGPTWHWNNTKGVCEEVSVVGTATR